MPATKLLRERKKNNVKKSGGGKKTSKKIKGKTIIRAAKEGTKTRRRRKYESCENLRGGM